MIGVLLPARPRVPEPGLVEENAEASEEAAGVEEEPPASLAELGHPGGQRGSPPVSVPSLHLEIRLFIITVIEFCTSPVFL